MRWVTLHLAVLGVTLILSGCRNGTDVSQDSPPVPALDTAAAESAATELGQLVYVPVYSHIYYRNAQRQMNLTATLSIRNADLRHSIHIRRVDYYDSEGAIVRSYIDSPVTIAALASRAFVVEENDTRGGVGANFIVEWESPDPVQVPIIQAVMITTASTQGISFVTEGYPITQMDP